MLGIARLHYADSVKRSSGLAPQVFGHSLILAWNDYEFQPVTPAVALRDAGYVAANDEAAVQGFRQLLGRSAGYEDPIFIRLKEG